MKKNIIFVTGFIGSDRVGLARQLADEKGLEFVLLDQEIEAKDGHEALKDLLEREAIADRGGGTERHGFVVACSDGIILDDECLSLLVQGQVVVADEALTPQQLWEQTKSDPNPAYAFLSAFLSE
ncbi:hypothetical protein JZU68_06785, partial [bacterium]|nr:hypothetical protein [bacterium]